jgi:hypothetical protein
MDTNTNENTQALDAGADEGAETSFELLLPSFMREWETYCLPPDLPAGELFIQRQAFLSGALAFMRAYDLAAESDLRVDESNGSPACDAVDQSLLVMTEATLADLIEARQKDGGIDEHIGEMDRARVIIRVSKTNGGKLTKADAQGLAVLINDYLSSRGSGEVTHA